MVRQPWRPPDSTSGCVLVLSAWCSSVAELCLEPLRAFGERHGARINLLGDRRSLCRERVAQGRYRLGCAVVLRGMARARCWTIRCDGLAVLADLSTSGKPLERLLG